MSSFSHSIPGGADTQIAQEAGNPEYVGLSPDQVGQAQSAYEASIARGRDGYRFQENASQSASQELTEPPKESTYRFYGPDDRLYAITGPGTQEEAMQYLASLPEDQLDPYRVQEGKDMDLRDKGRLITQGTLLGFGEEATAFLGAAVAKLAELAPGEQGTEDTSFGDIYRDIVYAERDAIKQIREDNPVESLAYEVGGGILTGGAGLNRVVGKTLAQKTAVSAGFGGTYGFGATDPEQGATTLENIGQRAKGGAIGAATGAVIPPTLSKAGKALKNRGVKRAMKTADGRLNLANKIEQAVYAHKAAGENTTNSLGNALKELGVSVDQAKTMMKENGKMFSSYNVTQREAADLIVPDKIVRKGISHMGLMKSIDQIIEPIYNRIEKHSPRIAQALRNYESNVYSDIHKWHTQLTPFINRVRKLHKSDKAAVAKMLYNSDFDSAKRLLVASDRSGNPSAVVSEFDDAMKIISGIGDEIEGVGAKFDRVDNYFPRRIKDIEGLKQALGSEYLTDFSAVLKRVKGKGIHREGNALNAYMRSVAGAKKRETSLRSRKMKEVTDELLDYYEDPVASLDLWMRDAAQQIHRRNLLSKGKIVEDKIKTGNKNIYVENVTDSLDNLVDALSDPSLTSASRNEIAKLLKIRFTDGEQGMSKFISNVKSTAHISMLGDIVSATTQLGDIGASMWMNGFIPTVKALFSKRKVTADDLGIMREMVNELSDPGSLNRWTDTFFRISGFRAVDKLGKNVAINSSLNNAIKTLRTQKGVAKMTKELAPYWGEETPALISQLKEGKITDLTKQYLFSKLSDMQPISRSEMPEAFLRMKDGRILYQFMTWTMKQFALVRKTSLHQIRYGTAAQKTQGLKNLSRALLYLGGANATSEQVKRWITNRDGVAESPEEIPSLLITHAAKNFVGSDPGDLPTLNVPAIELARRLGGKAVDVYNAPEFDPMDTSKQDLGKAVVKSMPLFGKMTYYWLLGGAEEFNEKQAKEREQALRSSLMR